MKYHFCTLAMIVFFAVSCQQKEVKGDFSFAEREAKSERTLASEMVDLVNKGVGPIDTVIIGAALDAELAAEGKALYEANCMACHKVGMTFIGPSPNGILNRRTPEWVMNMILAPEEMLQKDHLAQALFMEFDGQLMTDQGVSEAEARAILEYFRVLD